MSSKPKIIIAPKKKKKKKPSPLIAHVKNPSSSSVSAPTSAADRPASPDTVAAASAALRGADTPSPAARGPPHSAAAASRPGKKSSFGSILIRPFERPPELPPDFYDSSVGVLQRALACVLRHEALTAALAGDPSPPNAGDGGGDGRPRLIGREELYRSVEDLCVHKFGNRIYCDVVLMIDGAAAEVVRRLASSVRGDGSGSGNRSSINGGKGDDGSGELLSARLAVVDHNTGDVGYDACLLVNELYLRGGGCFRFNPSSMKNDSDEELSSYSSKRHALLWRMHSVCRSSYCEEYLTFVRSIFLALDRSYAYFVDVGLDKSGGGAIGVRSDVIVGGRVLERPAAARLEGGGNGMAGSRVWGLWEVGVACLRKHMLRRPTVGETTSSLSAGVGGECTDMGTLPALTAMVLTTAYAILSEYDENYAQSFSTAIGDTRPLVRNCVRTIIDLGALSSLLEELIVAASTRFGLEGWWWSSALAESRRSGPEYLLHVENRLRRGVGLTSYYLPSNALSGAALGQLARLHCLTGAVQPLSSSSSLYPSLEKVVWSPADNTTRRILPAIIEKRMLRLHLSSKDGMLDPRHLYPILDDDDGRAVGAASGMSARAGGSSGALGGSEAWKSPHGGVKTYENARRLHGLCWRMTVSSLSPPDLLPVPFGGARLASQSTLDRLRIAFGEYGRLRGSEIIRQGLTSSNNSNSVNNKEMEKRVVPDLLAFKNHLHSLHTVAFRSEEPFGNMVRSILDDVLNGATTTSKGRDDDGDGGRRIAELLAKHVDARFKDPKAQATASSSSATAAPAPDSMVSAAVAVDASESFQDEVLALFRHIHSKDVFEAFYKRDLAKRLLTGRSVSTDMERSFLSKLKAECGAGYTSKMEGMFKDMELSRDIMGSYAAYSSGAAHVVEVGPSGGNMVDMDVQVLTTGYWPAYPKYPNITLPPKLLALRTKFESYYDAKYQGRRISWQYSLGSCIVRANFPNSAVSKDLVVNLCQSLVLLCFQDDDGPDGRGLTLEDIRKKTGIDDRGELERVLQSLSMGRDGTRVLRKVDYDSPMAKACAPSPGKNSPPPRTARKARVRRNVGPQDRFLFNASFSSNQRRIRITNITMKETSEERKKTHASVSKDRLYLIDAAVVRVMKARKAIGHRDLIGEVMSQLRFPALGAVVKKRIESLIEREYMERSEGDRSRYKYLA